jgi:hypothetical protein
VPPEWDGEEYKRWLSKVIILGDVLREESETFEFLDVPRFELATIR